MHPRSMAHAKVSYEAYNWSVSRVGGSDGTTSCCCCCCCSPSTSLSTTTSSLSPFFRRSLTLCFLAIFLPSYHLLLVVFVSMIIKIVNCSQLESTQFILVQISKRENSILLIGRLLICRNYDSKGLSYVCPRHNQYNLLIYQIL